MFDASLFSVRWSAFATGIWLTLGSFPTALLAQDQEGTLQLSITDSVTGEIVPARVEILGADDAYHVAENALLVGGDCDMSDQGAGYVDLPSTLAGFSDRIDNFYSNSTQFYSDGTSSVRLPTGSATIAVFKGPEYEVSVEEVEIQAAATVEREIKLKRWINMPKKGWYSADDHLHIPRPDPELNPYILKMMQAEDIHVANLLQMGKVKNFKIAKQHAHGPESYYQRGDFILAAGQENPRSHFLGHTITLGADTELHNPDKYLIYRLIWEEAVKQGGINGFAHAYFPNGSLLAAHDGMALVLPHNLLHFVEVLQFNRSGYETWYDVLALGFRVTPTAGTDFPCADQTIPGNERFYTKVDGPLTYAKWLDSVRNGQTFVTTGPMIEFKVNDKDIGSEIILEDAAVVQIEGVAVFDPEKDDLAFLELIQNGRVIGRFSRSEGASKIEFSVDQLVSEASWFAVRGYGRRIDGGLLVRPFQFGLLLPKSHVHSAPIYVSLRNGPPIEKSVRSREVARTWMARLEDIERVLAEANMEQLAEELVSPDFDSVPKDVLMKNRQDLLQEIDVARDFFEDLLRQDSADEGH